ncbi:MerR family transcriptional regulator [Ktedonobacter racemifer]|uniref:Transcriptional regulator, MerR family n=1 Tax=Ktedonobacter racemifer DSM 44963 TaxID=485913 RepID=D6TQB3_KTERA|nr:GyrI-like domain-containing protein [Ktedonobacter racemifer]EFH85761.1 transcriptional regulator, MerR family [Ktedonobacter racemifer DSM 44963]
MFKIGEFSKLVQVPVPTLRYYDQVGLLKPVEVDDFTGYRYYSASQLPRLNRILALKGLGFELAQIGVVLTEGLTPEQMRGMLRLRHAQLSQQLGEMQSQLVEVEGRLQQIEQEETLSTYDVILKHVEPLLVASVRATLPTHNEISLLYAEVYAALEEHENCAGQPFVIWYDDEYKDQDIERAAAVALRHRVPESGRVRIHELPAALMATIVHQGGGTTRVEAQEVILTWIEANGYRIIGPSREVSLHTTLPISHDDASCVTEMQFPVEKAVPSHDLLHSKQRSL